MRSDSSYDTRDESVYYDPFHVMPPTILCKRRQMTAAQIDQYTGRSGVKLGD